MEPEPQKSLERVISQRAVQMSSSLPCKTAVAGFLSGICVTYLLIAASTYFKVVEFEEIYSVPSMANTDGLERSKNLSLVHVDLSITGECNSSPKQSVNDTNLLVNNASSDDVKVSLLYSAWSSMLDGSKDRENGFFRRVGLSESNVPKAPYIENCKSKAQLNQILDSNGENGSFPPWKIHKGLLGLTLLYPLTKNEECGHFGLHSEWDGAYPPWIVGSDEDNFPLTRKVQQDIWMHQHPPSCSNPQVRFLVADWEILPGYGLGAQIAGMCGLLAIAINEKRVLVTNYFNRADHEGCQGPSRSRWSCYFFPETSKECQDRAFELMRSKEAWVKGIVTGKENYTSKVIWAGRVPRVWGNPWDCIQPTTEIDGSLIRHHRKMDRRWWRAQAVRYLMRFQSEYTCGLLNIARHEAFGMQAAKLVLESLDAEWPQVTIDKPGAEMEHFVWSNHKPWIPRPLLSMHVRMGDKAIEMKVVGFETYMSLAERARRHFPNLNSIWLSTEMQEVINKSRLYPRWNFYYTNVTRQVGNTTMAAYEASLGRETSTNYPLINFLMAIEADLFIGALGSTWCFLIDGMRSTGGKVMSGYLSVNKDRFW